VKNITRLPDHDKKANLNDLTMGDKDDNENKPNKGAKKGGKSPGSIGSKYEEEK
jgi:hypothetical protein